MKECDRLEKRLNRRRLSCRARCTIEQRNGSRKENKNIFICLDFILRWLALSLSRTLSLALSAVCNETGRALVVDSMYSSVCALYYVFVIEASL